MVQDSFGVSTYNELMLDFEDAVLKQRSSCLPGSKLSDLKENRFQSRIQHRLTELEGNYLKVTLFRSQVSRFAELFMAHLMWLPHKCICL